MTLRPYPRSLAMARCKEAWGESSAAIHSLAKNGSPFEVERACWLPDERVAAIWRAFVVKGPKVRIVSPPGLGDGQPFFVHDTGQPLQVEVEYSKELEVVELSMFVGHKLLGEKSQDFRLATVGPLARGIHTLIAVATDKNGIVHYSTPHTILVR